MKDLLNWEILKDLIQKYGVDKEVEKNNDEYFIKSFIVNGYEFCYLDNNPKKRKDPFIVIYHEKTGNRIFQIGWSNSRNKSQCDYKYWLNERIVFCGDNFSVSDNIIKVTIGDTVYQKEEIEKVYKTIQYIRLNKKLSTNQNKQPRRKI